jgi:hypothetical protein
MFPLRSRGGEVVHGRFFVIARKLRPAQARARAGEIENVEHAGQRAASKSRGFCRRKCCRVSKKSSGDDFFQSN